MKQLLSGGASLFFHLYSFLAFGSLFFMVLGKKDRFSWCLVPVTGFFVYYGLFGILAFPLTLLLAPLHILTLIWELILAGIGILAAFLCGKMWMRELKNTVMKIGQAKWVCVFLLILVLAQMAYAAIYHQNTADAAFYVGNVSTSLYTDTLGRYSPYTGKALSKFDPRYVTATCYLDSAVFCKIFQVHPMVLTKTIAPVLVTLLANLLYYHLGTVLFQGNRKKAAVFTAAVLFFGLLAGNTGFSGFLYYRTFEGKAMIHGLVIPFLFLCFLWLYRNPGDRFTWWCMFFAALGGVSLSTSSMTLVPAAIGAGVLAIMVLKKTVRPLGPAFLCILPDAAVMFLYLGVKLGFFALAAK